MKLYTIRLKRQPELFVGKKNSSYAVMSGCHIRYRLPDYPNVSRLDVLAILQHDAHWFSSKNPKIFTSDQAVRTLLARGMEGDEDKTQATFDEYEVVVMENGKERIVSATDFYHKRITGL